MTIKSAFVPVAVDGDLSGYYWVSASAVPGIMSPLAFVNFSGKVVVIGAWSMAEVIEEIALVVIAIGVVHGALEGGGGVEVVALEALASWEEERRLHVIDFKMQ